MASKRPGSVPGHKFSGELNTPVVLPPDRPINELLSTTPMDDEAARQREIAFYTKHSLRKIDLLMKEYEVDQREKTCWRELATLLAYDFVPGMQIASEPKKRGRKIKWDKSAQRALVHAVTKRLDAHQKKGSKPSISLACKELTRGPNASYLGMVSSSLRRKYDKAKRVLSPRNALMAER